MSQPEVTPVPGADGWMMFIQQIAKQAWQPTMGHTTYSDGHGGTQSAIVPQQSPLLFTVATEMAKLVKDDEEIRALFIEGLKEALLTPEWIETLRRALPDIMVKGRTNYERAGMPDWVKESLMDHFREWLSTDDADDVIERMLSQSTLTVQVERASMEPRR